jgi:glycopeptide antibiotics resistance protein
MVPMKLFWPVALMAAIFLLSSLPGSSRGNLSWLVVDLNPTIQNALHIPLFGLLQWLWLRALTRPGRALLATIALAALITIGYGCLDEFHQSFVPGRYASLQDILLNTIGVVAGTLFFLAMARRTEQQSDRRMS